jgi:hypothetical protein
VAGKLTGCFGVTDANNALKTGYDAVARAWPAWLDALDVPRAWLPTVVEPGTPLTPLTPSLAQRLGLPATTMVVAGTTDSTAAILATGVSATGEAVTSLGSTLVMKVICDQPVSSPAHGVYSQPFGKQWLAGGGSNSGGAVLRAYFSDTDLTHLTPRLTPDRPTGLDYYPLLVPGERFPTADPQLAPRLSPRPADDAVFLQGLLEGMAIIEATAYRLLAQLGAPAPVSVRTTGGGAHNEAWTRIRRRLLGVPLLPAHHDAAAYGTALLARAGMTRATGL